MQIEEIMTKGAWMNLVGLTLGVIFSIIDQVNSQRSTQWTEGSLRLVGGRSKHEGTVLIYHWSRWGAICDDYWDIRDANVVCKELGFAGAKEAVKRSRFGKGRRRVWLSGVHCRGNERHVTMCYSRGWGNHIGHCKGYWSSAGVICNKRKITTTTTTTTTTKTTRPTTTSKKTTTRTTTEPTTTTTTRRTTKKPTTVVTTTTTTPKPTTTTKSTTLSTTKQPRTLPPPAYNIWIYDRETYRYFMYFRDGSFITSAPDPRYVGRLNTTTTTTTTTQKPTPHPTPRPRRIFSNRIQNQVPQEIRRREENSLRRHGHHSNTFKDGYQQDQPIMEAVDRDTSMSDDFDNSIESVDDIEESSESLDDVESEEQTARPTPPTYTDYRVKGGRDYKGFKEGRLEVRLANSFTWGVICGDDWDQKAAIVACRHFNAGYARQAQKTDYYGGSDMDKVIAKMRCTGKEERLEDCIMERYENTPGKIACSRPQSVAGIICDTRLPDLEPELKAIEESAFLRDRYLYYLQCAYEEKCLSSSADALYGSRTWAYASRRLLHFSTIAKNIGTADFRPDIDRSQWEWHACHQHYHSMEAFSHYDIIDSHGNRIAEGHKASFCLEDSKCDRGVFPKYNCQGFGHQGISVGCSDSYLSDIDCQWIDVTDVKPGSYTLKIELNPNMRVPEITFDNNVAICDLYFNTRTASVKNCKLGSLL